MNDVFYQIQSKNVQNTKKVHMYALATPKKNAHVRVSDTKKKCTCTR